MAPKTAGASYSVQTDGFDPFDWDRINPMDMKKMIFALDRMLYPLTTVKSVLSFFGGGIVLILIGQFIVPVSPLDQVGLDAMNAGKWISVGGFGVVIIAAILGAIGIGSTE